MATFTKETVEGILGDVAEGRLKIADLCKKNGISKQTFYQWIKDHPDFSDSVKEAKKERLKAFSEMADSGMCVLLEGSTWEEEKKEYGSKMHTVTHPDGRTETEYRPALKTMTKTIKRSLPNATMIIFVKTNVDREDWKHSNHIDHTTGGEKLPPPSNVDLSKLKDKTMEELLIASREIEN